MDGSPESLDAFLPVVSEWFRDRYGQPTLPQSQGWPEIAAGRHTLIFAPTGSGKTLAAFLACLDHLWRRPERPPGVGILYISPLKALNTDIARNLEEPLQEIHALANATSRPLPLITTGVRSGDTRAADRQKLVRKPPDVLITTPESLNLMLTSKARETLRSITHVIVDEIHALCSNKRGVFLALLLERLQANAKAPFVRIGLSATQRPLEEVARYLGGGEWVADAKKRQVLRPRPVAIVDTGQRKTLDLQVVSPFQHASQPRVGSIWPNIERMLLALIQEHRSTIVFANNRRVAERLTAHLNELATEGTAEADEPAVEGPVKSHHGSLSLDERRGTEDALKAGDLSAVVATASLELGIDMGAVELVCQVESPGSVARGLQRVGRAGHVIGRVSKGRIIPKSASDLVEAAALCRKMAAGEVEALRVPTNCLDVLAQQVVACVAVEKWSVPEIFKLVRQAYPYRDLPAGAFESVLKMISGRFGLESFRDLQPRISWDRVHNRLIALPGTARLAIVNGGTIPDTGHYPVYLNADGPRIGELDEEFVLERRVGETFILGTATWRIEAIEPQRVVVSRAEGHSAVMPFWRGEDSPRSAELGEAVGALCRDVGDSIDDPELLGRLAADYHLDESSARVVRDHLGRQKRIAGCIPDDRTILVETFRDPAGDLGLALLTPFGGKLHLALKMILLSRIRDRLGIEPACLHGDDGLLFRLPRVEEFTLDLFDGLTPEVAESIIRRDLDDTPLFGLRFRQNAGRALLMPRPDPSKRTPLWLQRLRAKDLLQVVRKTPDFPIVIETFRECLDDDLDIPRLRAFLESVQRGTIRVETRNADTPSPFVSDLIFRFEHHFLYQWDEPQRGNATAKTHANVDQDLLDPLLDPSVNALWLDPAAVGRVEHRLRGGGKPPRTAEEMAELLRKWGDVSPSELNGPMLGFLDALEREGRVRRIELSRTAEPGRFIAVEEEGEYQRAFLETVDDDSPARLDAIDRIVKRYLVNHALIGVEEICGRYPMEPSLAAELLERWAEAGGVVRLESADGEQPTRWADGQNLAEVRRLSMAIRRKESIAVGPEAYADFLCKRQGVHPATTRLGAPAFLDVLQQLEGHAAPAMLWESEIFPARVADYRPAWLDDALGTDAWIWRAEASEPDGDPKVGFLHPDLARLDDVAEPRFTLSEPAKTVLDGLERRGASFAIDLAKSLDLDPSRVRNLLKELWKHGDATNDRFDPVRATAVEEAAATSALPARRDGLTSGRLRGRRPQANPGEGRWSKTLREQSGPLTEANALAWTRALLDRYGVLTRETTRLDPWAPAWSDLTPFLARWELRGELRRGFFVEGLSGVQYADEETVETLAKHGGSPSGSIEAVMISTLDPANLYGSGAPFDVDLLEGGTARLPRRAGNHLVLNQGRPVLILERYGKRLTGLASASEAEIKAALAFVPRLARGSRRVLKIETYNGIPALSSPAAPWLLDIGFVRDFPGLAYYAGW